MSRLGRRALLANGALVVAFALSRGALAQDTDQPELPGGLAKSPLLDSWISVGADGQITVFTGKVELGQGLKTALIQIAAHELAVAPSEVDIVTADTARTPDEGVTAGSQSLQDSGTAILNAAANVRVLLAETAAWRFALAVDQIEMRDGAAYAPDGRTIGYGELVSGASLHVAAKPDVPRREGGARVIGEDLARIDIPAKVSGGEAFLQDMRLPGMLHARVVRGPSDGTRLKQANIEAVATMPGVLQVIRNGRFTAIVADDEWRAVKALYRLQAAGWERIGEPLPAKRMREAIRGLPAQPVPIFHYPGPPAPPEAHTLTARYSRPCLMHGSIGPSCAVALWEDDSVTVWTHSQGVHPLRTALAELLGLALERVRCVHVEGAGCYGHNGADDVAADAALAARAVPGQPVRLQWMREQEHGWEPLGSTMTVEMSGSLGLDGRIVAWQHEVWSNTHSTRPTTAGGLLAGAEVEPPFVPPRPLPIRLPEGGAARNSTPIYDLPNARGTLHFVEEMPVRVSALRSLGAQMNVFAIESFMDELAQAAAIDPVAFRLAHLRDERAREVVQIAAERFGWSARGRGTGFAFARYKNLASYCAVAMDVRIDRETGEIHMPRVVAAVDCGEAVSPDGIRNQIEGGIVQSLSWTMRESVTFDTTHRTSFDWSAYPILRFPAMPGRVEVHVIDRPKQPFLGPGEAAQGPAAAALANAVAHALGIRLRDMPLSPERIRAALRPTPAAPRQAAG
ncbi:MAG: xanthine dehydrogenase family protein molybdopterin-binding subunit [Enhydrobacter sp.]|nr:xanthine dehydrogenase family protein molybdopterin-binding subunit [Enhydrobacter sp.]